MSIETVENKSDLVGYVGSESFSQEVFQWVQAAQKTNKVASLQLQYDVYKTADLSKIRREEGVSYAYTTIRLPLAPEDLKESIQEKNQNAVRMVGEKKALKVTVSLHSQTGCLTSRTWILLHKS